MSICINRRTSYCALIFFILLVQAIKVNAQAKVDTLQAYQYYSKAIALIESGKRDVATEYINKAILEYESAKNWTRLAMCYNLLSSNYLRLSNFDQALVSAEKVLAMNPTKILSGDIEKGRAFKNAGDALIWLSNYDSAYSMFKQALPIFERAFTNRDAELGEFYSSMSQVYHHTMDYDRFIQYKLKTLDIYTKVYGEVHVKVGSANSGIAFAYMKAGAYDSALNRFYHAVEIFKKLQGDKSHLLFYPYNIIGEIYNKRQEYEKAITYLKLAEALDNGSTLPNSIMNYRDLGVAYTGLNDFKSAITNFGKALKISERVFGKRHPATASIYKRRAFAKQNMGSYQEALLDFQRALISNSNQFDNLHPYAFPDANDKFDDVEGLSLLISKAELLWEVYTKDHNVDNLRASLKSYQLMDARLHASRSSRLTHNDKVRLDEEHSAALYGGAIKTCMKLYTVTDSSVYKNLAFYFSQQNKGMILAGILSEAKAKNKGLVPDELLDLEGKLNQEIAEIQSQIQNNKASVKKNANELSESDNKLFFLNRQLDSVKATMQKSYPQYYQMEFANSALDIQTLQKRIPSNTLMLQYFEADESIYLFSATLDSYSVKSFSKDTVYTELLNRFLQSINPPEFNAIYSEAGYLQYVQTSHELYKLLLKESIESLGGTRIKNLVIIPDGKLSYLPFDVLLTTMPSGKVGDYASLPYLLKKYAVIYGHSPSLQFSEFKVDNQLKGEDLLSFAPSYENIDRLSSNQVNSLGKFRDAVGILKWNQSEVKNIEAMLGGSSYLGDAALEERFKEQAAGSNIIHLAMHALTDDVDPMNSKLVFAQNSNSKEDGLLHAFELYNMKLHAQMVVLSACNTGYGKLAKGEGIVSLGRAFAYAGVPSVIMSHWKVDDEATSTLMHYFYTDLAKGITKGEALRQAKLNYLANADPSKSHPFYWAAFISMGSDEPIQVKPKTYTLKIMAGLGLVALMGIGIWYWKNRRRPA
jgi:CHAT domain-containing protein